MGVEDVRVGDGGWVVCGTTVVGWAGRRSVEGTGSGEWDVMLAVGLGVADGVEGAEVGVRDCSGVSVGPALDGDTLGAVAADSGAFPFPPDSSSSQVPVPPTTRTAAPPTIHGAFRRGRR